MTLAIVLIVSAWAQGTIIGGMPGWGAEDEDLANAYADSLILEWAVAKDSVRIRWLLRGIQEFGPPSSQVREQVIPTLCEVAQDTAALPEFTQYLAVAQMDDWGVGSEDVVDAFRGSMQDTLRHLVRLASGVALVKLGYVLEALPVVEGYASSGWQYPDTMDTTHTCEDDYDPVTPFYWGPWREPDPVAEESLNAYMVRVLGYPHEIRRIEAIIYLLEKHHSIDLALDAAELIVDDPQPCAPGDVEYAEQSNLLSALRKHGGARGRDIARRYAQ